MSHAPAAALCSLPCCCCCCCCCRCRCRCRLLLPAAAACYLLPAICCCSAAALRSPLSDLRSLLSAFFSALCSLLSALFSLLYFLPAHRTPRAFSGGMEINLEAEVEIVETVEEIDELALEYGQPAPPTNRRRRRLLLLLLLPLHLPLLLLLLTALLGANRVRQDGRGRDLRDSPRVALQPPGKALPLPCVSTAFAVCFH